MPWWRRRELEPDPEPDLAGAPRTMASDLIQAVVEASKDAIVVIDRTGSIEIFNPAAETMFGWTFDDVFGQPLDLLMPVEYRERHQRYVASFFAHGQPSGAINRILELPAVRASGELFPVELSLSAAVTDEGPFVLAIIRDVTERRTMQAALQRAHDDLEHKIEERTISLAQANQALHGEISRREQVEQVLREAESRFSRFTASTSDVLCRYDPIEKHYDFVSPSFEHQTGYQVWELQADPEAMGRRIIHPDDYGRYSRTIEEHSREGPGAGSITIEYRVVRKDGRVIWVSVRRDCEHDSEGRLSHVNSVIRDITERKEAEERFTRFANTVTDVIYRYDFLEARYDFVSPSFERQTGYPVAELMSDHRLLVERATHPDDQARTREAVRRHAARGPGAGPIEIEYQIRRADGQEIWVNEALDFEFTADRRLASVNSVVRDVTQRRQAEAEREQLIEELEAKNAELDRYTYTVSHDLKSPLITIQGFLGLMKEEAEEIGAQNWLDDIGRVSRATERMAALLDDLLELSRVGRIASPHQRVHLEDLAAEAIELVAGRLAGGRIKVDVAAALPEVTGDRARLVQVLQNLLDNAAKFMGDQPRPRIEIGVRRDDGREVIFVRDNGVGIEPQHREKVFGLFDKLDQNSAGTGVGLALVKRIVEVHGGRIWVESGESDRGATFCFTLGE